MNDKNFLKQAVTLAEQCPSSETAYAVGAVIVDTDGKIMATGYSREYGEIWHAEEVAIEKSRRKDIDLTGSTLYTSIEPCSTRKSRSLSCCDHILKSGITHVVFCLKEPPHFVKCEGVQILKDAGLIIEQDETLIKNVYKTNKHLEIKV